MAEQHTSPGSTSVSAGTTQSQLALALILGVVLAGVFIQARLPTGAIPRWLSTHPRELLLAAALLVLIVLPMPIRLEPNVITLASKVRVLPDP